MANQPPKRGRVRSVEKINGKLRVEIGAATPSGLTGTGGGGRTEAPVYNAIIEVEDTPANRKTYYIGANVAHSYWPPLSVMEAAGLA